MYQFLFIFCFFVFTGMLSKATEFSETVEALPVFDPEFSCTLDSKAKQYASDFGINVRAFGGVELCNPQTDSKKLFNDLSLIEMGRFQTPTSPHRLIGNFVHADQYYGWLKAQTEGMTRANDVPWATAYNSMGYFTMQDGWAQLSTLGRVGVLIHEARHTEGYRHIACQTGPYAQSNLPGCDPNFNYGGSHAVEMEYYARVVVYGENFHPLYKKMARLMALGRSNFVFNQKVLEPREALYLIRQDGLEARIFDGERAYPREVTGQGWLKRTSYGATLFSPLKAIAQEAYDWIGDQRPVDDGYSYFKLLTLNGNQPSNQPPKDLEEFDSGNKRYLAALDYKNQFGLYNFPKGAWGNFQNLPGTPLGFKTQIQNKRGLFIVLDSFKVLQWIPQKDQLVEEPLAWDSTDISYVQSPQGETLQLKADGVLRTLNGQPWGPTQEGLWSQVVNIPLYNGFEVR